MNCTIGRSVRLPWRWRAAPPISRLLNLRKPIFALQTTASWHLLQPRGSLNSCLSRYRRLSVSDALSRIALPLRQHDREPLHILHNVEHAPSPWNIANAVTAGRIAVTPLIGHWILSADYNLALTGLVYAGASDWLDGVLARRLHLRTVLGSILDPIADKLLISTTTVCLAVNAIIPAQLAVLIVGRDIGLVVGYLWQKRNSNATNGLVERSQIEYLQPLVISKLNTCFQISLGFAGVLHAAEWGVVTADALEGLGYMTALSTTASGLSYAKIFWRNGAR